MATRGLDIREQHSQHLDEFLNQDWGHVLTVCDAAAESCLFFPGAALAPEHPRSGHRYRQRSRTPGCPLRGTR